MNSILDKFQGMGLPIIFSSSAFMIFFSISKIKNFENSIILISFLLFIALVLILISFYLYNKSINNYSSKEWFKCIIEKLEDNDKGRIFLRQFDHPENFIGVHKDDLTKIMKLIKEKISNGADFQIIAYSPSSEKNGYKWLEDELRENINAMNNLKKNIKIIQTQPVSANSSSAYIFNDNSVLYNRRVNGKNYYYINDLNNSILHSFIEKGFEKMDVSND